MSGNLKVLKALLAAGADVNRVNKNGESALHFATQMLQDLNVNAEDKKRLLL